MSSDDKVFVSVDFLDSFSQKKIRHTFAHPLHIVRANKPSDVTSALGAVERYVDRGFYAAGYIAYEALHAFYSASSAGNILPGDEPLLWFGIFEKPLEPSAGLLPDLPGEDSEFYLSQPEVDVGLEQYRKNILDIISEIENGNVYQVNYAISQYYRFFGDPVSLYHELVKNQDSGYNLLAYNGIDWILSISPELFFHKKSDIIRMKPMKGTIERSTDPGIDEENRKNLFESSKDRAENSMIVDLLRNDLGKICKPGSVRVKKKWEIERYPTLFQMTSTIDGILNNKLSFADLFTALFPGGSITGAPKRDAIRYISQLEKQPRGIYTGAVGFFAPGGESIFNIAIRTLRIRENKARLGIGSGVVYDSSPEDEYGECLLKGKFVQDAIDSFGVSPSRSLSLIETFRYSRGRYRFLEDHMKRMQRSALAFGVSFSKESILASLDLDRKKRNIVEGVFRTRVELNVGGSILVEHLPFVTDVKNKKCFVGISQYKVSSRSGLLGYKTSLRSLFEGQLKKAVANGWADMLFFNEMGLLTQGCIHNIFVKIDGSWVTPPLEDGLLPGIMRARLLKKFSPVFERSITLRDLQNAQCIILCNSLRGIRRATLVLNYSDEENSNIIKDYQ